MRMQVILDSVFARPGSAAIGGGKKGEFRDWTNIFGAGIKQVEEENRNNSDSRGSSASINIVNKINQGLITKLSSVFLRSVLCIIYNNAHLRVMVVY